MKIQIPTHCPCCEYPLELVNSQLFCRNIACSAQLQSKLEHFTKVLGIKGFGAKTIEKLNLQDITELFYLDHTQVAEALNSERTATKLLDEIDRARGADLATVLAAFSIPLVGATASGKISQVVTHISEINLDACERAGLGEKVTQNLLNWLQTEFVELQEFLPFSWNSSNTSNATGFEKTICITGKLSSFKTKAEAHRALVSAGFRPADSVTKTTDYLVDEEGKSSTKRKKADSLGIEIITNLQIFLKENTND